MPSLLASLSRRPAARAVVMFGGLNLVMVLIYITFGPSRLDPPGFVAYRHAGALALRVALVLGAFALILWAVRPGVRTRAELALVGAAGAAFTGLLSVSHLPFVPLTVVPIVARSWLGLRETALLTLGLAVATAPLWRDALVQDRLVQGGGVSPLAFLAVLLVTAVLNGYTLLGFEFALREARAREELAAHGDLAVRHAELAERTRLSRELHDTLGHHLTAQRFDLQLLRTRVADEAARPALDRAEARNLEALADLRLAVRALRPETLAGGLAGALRDLASGWPSPVRLDVRGEEPPLSSEHKLALYRAAQEALTNARRHAPGAAVEATLRFGPDGVEFVAGNDAPGAAGPEGHGLRGLRERASHLGGRCEAVCRGGRFTLRVSLPLAGRAGGKGA